MRVEYAPHKMQPGEYGKVNDIWYACSLFDLLFLSETTNLHGTGTLLVENGRSANGEENVPSLL
jgi:hypothetical protein